MKPHRAVRLFVSVERSTMFDCSGTSATLARWATTVAPRESGRTDLNPEEEWEGVCVV